MRCSIALACSLLWFPAVWALAQSPVRQIQVKVLDDVGRPLANAQVAIRSPLNVTEESYFEPSNQVAKIIARTTSDDAGNAQVTIPDDAGVKEDEPVTVTAWKLGYGPQNVSVVKTAEIRCAPVRHRTLQVVDDAGKPLAGLRVIRDTQPGDVELFDPPWWNSAESLTSQFGVAKVETPDSLVVTLRIVESDGTVHRYAVNDLSSRLTGHVPDMRDMQIVSLARYGKVVGQMPTTFASDYGILVRRELRTSFVRTMASRTSVVSEAKLQADGSFEFAALEEGDYWLSVYRKTPYTDTPPNQTGPKPLQQVKVVAGETAHVEIGSVPLAKVNGRIQSGSSSNDYTGVRLLVSQKTASPAQGGIIHSFQNLRVLCKADGTYETWLPSGLYMLNIGTQPGWYSTAQTEFEVGNGAASVTVKDAVVVPTKSFRVVCPDFKSPTSAIQSAYSSRLVFQLDNNQFLNCLLSADGFGKVEIPTGTKVVSIFQGTPTGEGDNQSGFIDRDESDNFRLELVTELQGRSTNIGVKGRVVNKDNQPLAGVSVTVTLASETVPNPQDPSQLNMSFGKQILDVVTTDQDGKYSVAPRQLLRNIVIPSRNADNECKFTFAASPSANTETIEQQRVYKSKPSQWNQTQIELPDLVIDQSAAGKRLAGKLLDATGKPSVGELIRLSDRRQLIRALSDAEGNFAFEDVSGPAWLLRESDWSLHAVPDPSNDLVIAWKQDAAAPVATSEPWQRLEKSGRLALAKDILNKLPAVERSMAPDEMFLEPEKYLADNLLRRDPRLDDARVLFAAFWPDLSDEQLERLSEASVQSYYQVLLLRQLADRHPSAEAYARAMEAVQPPQPGDYSVDRLLLLVGEVGLKLFHYGALEPQRGKIKQLIDASTEQRNKMRARLPQLQQLSALETEASYLCRALLEPDEFAARVTERLQADPNELSNEDRMTQMREVAVYVRMFPEEQFTLQSYRGFSSGSSLAELGAKNPMAALEAAKQGKISAEALRHVVLSALETGHPDARPFFLAAIPIILRVDPRASRLANPFASRLADPIGMRTIPSSFSNVRPVEMNWVRAARQVSPELEHIAAWSIAFDYLNGEYDPNLRSILPIQDRRLASTLGAAHALSNQWPDLARQIVDRTLPRMQSIVETEFEQPYARATDVSLAAYFAPENTVELILKLQSRYDEELKNQPKGARVPNSGMSSKRNALSNLKISCLRGLLLEKM